MINSVLKKGQKSALLKESLIYGVTNALYSGLPILILPFLIQVLDPKDYGLVDFYRNLSLLMTPILGLSTVQSITRFYYDLKGDAFKTFVSNILVLHFINALIGTLILIGLSFFISKEYYFIVQLCILFFLFNQITEALLDIFRVQKKPKMYLMFRIMNIVLDLSFLAVLYFVFDSFDWTYRVLPNVLAVALVGVIALGYFYRNSYFKKFDFSLLKQALLYSTPLILHMISGYMMNIGDRFFILYYLTEEDLGNYAVAYQLGMLVNFFYTSFNLAWVPTFFGMMEKKEYSKIKKIKIITYIGITLFSIFVFSIVFLLLNYTTLFDKYDIQISVVIVVLIAYMFNSIYKFEANYFFYNKKTKQLSFITLGAAIITIVLNLLLIQKIGIMGCAIATLTSSLYMYIRVVINKKFKI